MQRALPWQRDVWKCRPVCQGMGLCNGGLTLALSAISGISFWGSKRCVLGFCKLLCLYMWAYACVGGVGVWARTCVRVVVAERNLLYGYTTDSRTWSLWLTTATTIFFFFFFKWNSNDKQKQIRASEPETLMSSYDLQGDLFICCCFCFFLGWWWWWYFFDYLKYIYMTFDVSPCSYCCVGPQNKVGHPAGCRFPCWVPAGYK